MVVLNWRDPWHPEGGGSEYYVHEVAQRLVDAGYDVTWMTAAYPGASPEEMIDGVRFVRRGGRFTIYGWAARLLLEQRCAKVLRKNTALGPIDVVLEVQNGMPFLASLTSGTEVVVLVHHVHRDQWSILGPLMARVGWLLESRVAVRANRKRRYITVADATRQDLTALGVRPNAITLAYNGVPPMPAIGAIQRSENPSLVVLSRLVPHKQIEHAIQAMPVLRQEFPDARLRIVGDGWWAPELKAEAERQGVTDAVDFLGFVDNETKFRELASAWVHVLPSVKEGWGLSIVEAAQMRTPSVAYGSAGGVTEAILDGVTGLLATDQASLNSCIGRILREQDLRQELGHKALVRSGEFSWDTTASTIAAVLDEPN